MTIVVLIYIIYRIYNKKYEGMEPNTPNVSDISKHASQTDPYILPTIMKNLLNETEINSIIDEVSPKIASQNVIEGRYVYEKNKQHSFIKKDNEIIKPILEKISKKMNLPYENMENPLVIRYLPYQYYTEHVDSCCNDNDKCRDFVKRGGQRVLTLIIYLSDNFEGGSTHFKKLNLNLKPNKGGAIIFHPLAQNSNKCHPNGIYQEQPLNGGIKWVMRVRFREHQFK